jgi:hypothetical protein
MVAMNSLQLNGRRSFLKESALATLGLAALRVDAEAFANLQTEDAEDQHNMLVVGNQAVFLAHLPMFHAGQPTDPAVDATGTEFTAPHRYQVILEATFTNERKDVSALYVKDRQANPSTRIYTVEPQQLFVLSRLFTPEAKPRQRSFTAKVFRGHLERGGEPIPGLNPVTVEITRVVHGRKFTPKGNKPVQLEYILFGRGSELFLAHAIFAPPDFDQVLSIEVEGRDFTDADLRRDVRVVFSDRKNVAAARLREGENVSGLLTSPGSQSAAGTPIRVQAKVEFYFEEGELLVPSTFKPTPEELRKKP